MIVDSMTLEEIHRELHADVENTGRTVAYRIEKFKSVVLKSRVFPVKRHYECKSQEKKNRFFVQLTAFKRSEWKDPLMEYYCLYDRPEGIYCATINYKMGLTFVFPPHFFARYRERVVQDTAISNVDLIHLFISRVWSIFLVHFPPEHADELFKWDEAIKNDNLRIMGLCPDGIIFGERQDNVFIGKTIVTDNMLFEDQLDLYDLLFDEYIAALETIYPEKIVDHILDSSLDYAQPMSEAEQMRIDTFLQQLGDMQADA